MTTSNEPTQNKTKSELLVEINNLKKQINDNEDFLTEIGIIKKETFMSRIEALEENTIKKINDLIAECVNETGRDFPWILVTNKMSALDRGICMQEEIERSFQTTNSNQG